MFASESELESRASVRKKSQGGWPVYEVQQMPAIDPHPSHLTDTSVNSRRQPRQQPRYSNFLA